MAIKKTPTAKAAPVTRKVSTKKAPTAAKKTVAKKAAAVAEATPPATATTAATPAAPMPPKKAAPARKKAATKKVSAAQKRAASLLGIQETVTPEQRYKMISTMAYFRAEQRGFEPGWETHDWLESEKEVDEMLRRRQKS
jgi:hypothetical protein